MSRHDAPGVDRTVLMAGATGLVGRLALARLLDRPEVEHVVAVGRRPPALTHARLEAKTVDFARLDAVPPVHAGAALCALGTTIKVAGSQAAFRAVDHDAVLACARWARAGGAPTFALVSSVGAASGAGNFYLRVKGEAEEAVAAVGFPRLVVLRPSLLLGDRAERRLAEAAAQVVTPALNPLLLGPLRRYRAVDADRVAAALVAAALDRTPGREVWEYDHILAVGPA
jgi:uncharacterized protein YbjT (DUF2867 family)